MFTPGKRDLTNGGVLEGDSSNHMGLSENVVSQNPLYNWSVLIITFMHIPQSMAVATSLLRMDMFGGFMSIPFCVCLKIWYPFFFIWWFFRIRSPFTRLFWRYCRSYFQSQSQSWHRTSQRLAASETWLCRCGAWAMKWPWRATLQKESKTDRKAKIITIMYIYIYIK